MAPHTKDMPSDLAKHLETFHEKVSAAAENILFDVFPTKILDLQALIDSIDSADSPFCESNVKDTTDATVYPEPSKPDGPETKKRKTTKESNHVPVTSSTEHARYPNLVRANPQVDKLHGIIKRECESLIQLCDKVKLWVNLTMPKIEDGDNFGVEVQTEALNVLEVSQGNVINLRDGCRQHHLNRAKICSKIIKYPNIEDYTLALEEHDDKQYYLARRHLHDLRNMYAVMTDILHKNIGKIRAPKGNNNASLY